MMTLIRFNDRLRGVPAMATASWRRARSALWAGALALVVAACGQTPGSEGVVAAGASEKAATGGANAAGVLEKAATVAPVFRFAKISNGAYFFTGSVAEKDQILAQFPDFRCEGLAFFQGGDATSGVPVYRFANLGNGGYFFTASQAERDWVQANRPDMRFEGSSFSVVSADTQGSQPVYRLANLANGAYLFTTSAAERDYAVSLGNWRAEGIAFHGAPPDPAQAGAAFCTPPVSGPPSVTGLSVDSLFYLGTSTFTVRGTNLGDDIGLVSSGCAGMTAVPGGSATARSFRCSPTATGNVLFRVVQGDLTLYSAAGDIPIPRVRLSTSLGDIVVQLDPAKAPVTVANFLQYVRDGFYDGLIFHRVISSFVVQGGGFNASLQQKTTRAPIVLESNNGLSNTRGTIAMARTSAANSATSQFFINVVDNLFLNYTSAASPGYAVFGSVVQGLDVVDQIRTVPTGTVGGFENVPTTPVVISRVTQIQ